MYAMLESVSARVIQLFLYLYLTPLIDLKKFDMSAVLLLTRLQKVLGGLGIGPRT